MVETTSELLAFTPARYRSLVRTFLSKLEDNQDFVEKVSYYLASKVGDHNLAQEFTELSPDIRVEACVENIVIGLTSGSLEAKEIKKLIK